MSAEYFPGDLVEVRDGVGTWHRRRVVARNSNGVVRLMPPIIYDQGLAAGLMDFDSTRLWPCERVRMITATDRPERRPTREERKGPRPGPRPRRPE